MIQPHAYYTVQGWMREELGLKGNALAVYAIIYGFSQDGASEYAGSSRYLAEWLGCSKQTILTCLADLTEKGHIIKRTTYQNGVTFCNYVAARNMQNAEKETGQKNLPPVKNFDQGGQKIIPGAVKNFDQGGQKTVPHITRDNTRYIDKEIEIEGAAAPPAPPAEKEKDKPVKHKHGEYANVLLTDDELAKLRQQFPHDLPARIERLSEYIASTGKKYKSHYATIRSWANKDKAQQAARPRGYGAPPANLGPNGIPIDQSGSDLDAIF